MSNIFIDPKVSSRQFRDMIYRGDVAVLTRLSPVQEFVEFAREELRKLFAPHDPQQAHLFFTPEQAAQMLGVWKPWFIHHAKSKELTRAIAVAAGFDPADTYYDVPKPRTSFPSDHLTTGIAFAFPWHRDTWYAAPAQQINWWLPVFDIRPDNAMRFDLRSFARDVENDSVGFDSYQANRDRMTAAKQIGKDTRSRPGALNHTAMDEQVLLPAPGQIIVFSGAHLHGSIPNTSGISRYSIDFRTLSVEDVHAGVGAPTGDVHCTGTMLREFARISDEERLPEEFVREMAGAPPEDVILLFDEKLARKSGES